nr:LysR family transcriptional regulator [Aeromonas dhakensis]
MLNYKQLYYFWHVARSGSVTRAAEQLHLTPQTVSGQVAELELSLGVALFNRVGRRLALTAAGRQALEQAGAIFSLGADLEHTLRHASQELTMQVGIADSVPVPWRSSCWRLPWRWPPRCAWCAMKSGRNSCSVSWPATSSTWC